MCLRIHVRVTLSILQSQFIEKGLKRTQNVERNVVLLLLLFTLKKKNKSPFPGISLPVSLPTQDVIFQ